VIESNQICQKCNSEIRKLIKWKFQRRE
jgi:hypothetical protein